MWFCRVSIAHSISIQDFAVAFRMTKIMLIQGFSYRFNTRLTRRLVARRNRRLSHIDVHITHSIRPTRLTTWLKLIESVSPKTQNMVLCIIFLPHSKSIALRIHPHPGIISSDIVAIGGNDLRCAPALFR